MSWHVGGSMVPVSHHSQEHGKANTQLISKTSKGAHFLPKITRTCPSVSASLPLSPLFSLPLLHPISPSPPSPLHPFIVSPQCETFSLYFKIWTEPRHHSPRLFLVSARCKSSGIDSVGPVQERVWATYARGAGVILHTQNTQNQLF